MKRFAFFSPKVWLTLCLGVFLLPWWLGFAMQSHQVMATQSHKNRSSSRIRHHVEPLTPMMLVDVEGAVHHPGLYRLPLDARAYQAILAAGGMTKTADRLATDLAQVLEDGAEIVVPTKGSVTNTASFQSSSIALGSTSRKHKLALGESININQATVSQLEELPGIGVKRAQAILLFKKQHGAFLSLSSLQGIKGIGAKELQKLLPYCRIG